MLQVTPKLGIPLREFSFQFSRSSGAGGQHVNKVNTRVTLRWKVATSPSLPEAVRERFVARFGRRVTRDGELVLHSQRFRDQGRNVADVLERLRGMLAEVATPGRPRKPTRPTRAAQERRLQDKRAQKERKARRRRPRVSGAED